uniref:Uncharacterized protein n=1 Tax=Laticauda laticaudata TaxID=8630 RepID=A0A8C5WVJ7_LATLA
MLFIEIILNQKKTLLVTVYIIEYEYTNVCIVGDLNAVSDKEKVYKIYPTKKQYTFFSNTHHSWIIHTDQNWFCHINK